MSYPVDPNSGLPPSDPGANRPPQETPPAYPPYPGAPYPGAPYPGAPYPGAPYPGAPYPGGPQPQTPGYPAQPQGPYPYGAYPPAYNQNGYPQPQPPRQRNTTLWVILGIVAVVVIGACVGCAVLVGSLFSTVSKAVQPLSVVQEFCDDEVSANYSAAYADLSTAQQANLTEDQFVAQSMARDTSEGNVTVCNIDISGTGGISASSTGATVDVAMTRSIAGDFDGTVTLINTGSGWKIDQIDSSLPILTDGTPTEQFTATPSTPTDLGTETPTP